MSTDRASVGGSPSAYLRQEAKGHGARQRSMLLAKVAFAAAACTFAAAAPMASAQAQQKPNILVIFGDDIGQTNISAYSEGLVGYRTPNIDRIAEEGMKFTDYYAENSCTAGRSSFITGQTPKRTGLSKVDIPGATVGLLAQDITIAQAINLARSPLGRARRAAEGPRPARARLRLVYRGVRHRRPEGRQGAARRALWSSASG
jgi:Sulfatase